MQLIKALQNPRLYDHPVKAFEVLETHISWVLLTGSYAYKIKKPVDFGFVDFTTLEKRRHYCHEELRLNRRLAPELYLDVVAITGSAAHPAIAKTGEAIEYAVKMRQFPQENLLDRITARHQLDVRYIDSLVDTVAEFHQQIATAAPDTPYGTPEQTARWAEQNFDQIRPLLRDHAAMSKLERLHAWLEQTQQHCTEIVKTRKQKGFIRECHGDMHLGNMVLIDDRVTIFDCIEFNDELRWIDVMSDIAFLVMDLHDHAYPELANRFLDRYLARTGDYAGLGILPYYLVYRALVRAKIDLIRLTDSTLTKHQARLVKREFQGYLDLALGFSHRPRPALLITHGLSASGKSTLAARVAEQLGAVCVHSDIERKRLFGLEATAASGSSLQGGIYSEEATRRTYQRLAELAGEILAAGYPVIVDAAFLQRWQRELLRELAERCGVNFIILATQVPTVLLHQRIQDRQQSKQDPSEADQAVLESQLKTQEPLTADEKARAISFATTAPPSRDILNDIRSRIAG